jgi:hypothetical protein
MRAAFSKDRLFLGRSANGASTSASTAGNAGIGVDHELAIAFADSVDGTLICASTASDALFTDNVRHSKSTSTNISHIL